MAGKASKGGQKIKMVKIENKNHLQVTFSKRRTGLYNKANELCILTGAEVLLITVSPSEKVYTFGHPCAESLIDRFLSEKPYSSRSDAATQYLNTRRAANAIELNNQLRNSLSRLADEKKRAERLKEKMKDIRSQGLWSGQLDGLELSQLEQLKAKLNALKKNIAERKDEMTLSQATPDPAPTMSPLLIESSSSEDETDETAEVDADGDSESDSEL